MDIFYAVTMITLGNGKMTPFCNAPWLDGRKPKETVPLILNLQKERSGQFAKL
jgi:hypothetical protein